MVRVATSAPLNIPLLQNAAAGVIQGPYPLGTDFNPGPAPVISSGQPVPSGPLPGYDYHGAAYGPGMAPPGGLPATVAPIMPRQMPAAIAAGQVPTTAPSPQDQMASTNEAMAYAAEKFKEGHNAWDSAAQGFINGTQNLDDQAKLKSNREAAAELLGDNPDLKKAVASGVMDVQTGYSIAQQRAQTSKAEVRKASITDYLKQSGDHDIAEQYASGILDENGVASALAAKDKASTTGLTDDQKELAQINAENKAQGLPEVSMAEYKATKNGTSPLSSDAALQDLPTVQVDDKGFPDHAQQEQFLATLKPDDATLVRKIANYEMDITKVTSLRGGDRERVAALVGQFDPTFDMTQYTKRAKSKVAYSTGPQGQAIAAANTSIAHLGTLYEEFGKLNNQPFTPWNSLANGVKGTFSDKELLNLRSTKQTVATELAKFFKGSGVVDVQSTQEWLDRFDEATGSAAMQDNIKKVIGDLMKARLDEIEQQYRSDMGKPADFRFLSIKTESILKDMGITADSVDPTSGIGAGDTSGDTSTDTPPADAPEETPLQVTPNDKGAWKALPKGRKYTLPGDPHIYEKQ